jgi:ribosomal protein S18 acetylase RimI-like enzyme
MEYRKIEEADIRSQKNTIFEFFKKVYHNNFPEDIFSDEFWPSKINELSKFLKDGSAIVYGAFDGDELTGFIWGYLKEWNKSVRIHIPILVVRDGYERKGVAKVLMQKMKDYATVKNIRTLEVMVTSSNDVALAYYSAVGFKEVRELLELRLK